MAESDADALRARLQELLPTITEVESTLQRQQTEYAAVLEASTAAESARDSLTSALESPLCVAQASVNQALCEVAELKREPIDELRSIAVPPRMVVRALSIVHGVLFGRGKASPLAWRDLKQMLRGDDFLPRVRGFRVQGSHLLDDGVLEKLRAEIAGESPSANARRAKVCANRASSNGRGSPSPPRGGRDRHVSAETSSQDEGPITEASVARASQAAGVLFKWAGAQLNIAPLVKDLEAPSKSECNSHLGMQVSIAEAARLRIVAAATLCNLQVSLEKAALASPVAMLDAIHSVQAGPEAVASLEAQLRGAEAMLAELDKRRSAMDSEMGTAQKRLKELRQENSELEVKLEEIQAAPAGPPFCDCGQEMVMREVGNLVDPNWGRSFWKCPVRNGCGKKIWEDSIARATILDARVGG
eukprot:TRINITY_DN22633_c0_g1_i2.p1 TRINITY_DN22633_c0_g1~~TRINITY_DN22633_c0_g1_i2.p1  ORF type:complete len:417 (+),score=69.11 TRINITY_DN22633_c0_g1_i2:59-1309(+)